MKIIWTERARKARRQAIEYIATQNRAAAIRVLEEISQQTARLHDHPETGRIGPRQKTRELVISRTPFVIIYRYLPKSGTVEIMRFLHGAQKWLPKG